MSLADRTPPTPEEFQAHFKHFSNWERWGDDDQLGTLTFITGDVGMPLIVIGGTGSPANPIAIF